MRRVTKAASAGGCFWPMQPASRRFRCWRRRAARRPARVSFESDPFSVGVASGDPTPSGVVLWTRLAPKPLEPGGGLDAENVEVAWEVADDEAMRNVVSRGTTSATPQLGHSVHVEVDGLEPDRWYWYRFRAGDAESPIGRTRTMPAADASPHELRFAVRILPALRSRAVHGLRAHGQGRARPGVSPGRLHLRVRGRGRPRPQARRQGDPVARRLPHPPRAVQIRPAACRRCTPAARGWSCGTTTSSTTTARTTFRKRRASTRSTSSRAARTRTRRTTR